MSNLFRDFPNRPERNALAKSNKKAMSGEISVRKN